MSMVDLSLPHIDALGLRHAVSLSLLSGKPFRLHAGYERITKDKILLGLLSGWEDALSSIGAGSFESRGDDLIFTPSRISGGNYSFTEESPSSIIETALLLMPALFHQGRRSSISIEGITHAEGFHSTDFVRETLLGLLELMGFYAHFSLKRFGFAGSGGGRVESRVYPAEARRTLLSIPSSGVSITGARVYFAKLDTDLAMAQREVLARELSISPEAVGIVNIQNSRGPGFFMQAWMRCGSLGYVASRALDFPGGEMAPGPGEEAILRAIRGLSGECASYTRDGLLPVFLARELAPYCIMSGNEPPRGTDDAVRETLSVCGLFLE